MGGADDRRPRTLHRRRMGRRLKASGARLAARPEMVEQMCPDEPDPMQTGDGDLADGCRDMERIHREAADRARSDRMIDEWGRQSFPASDPPPTW